MDDLVWLFIEAGWCITLSILETQSEKLTCSEGLTFVFWEETFLIKGGSGDADLWQGGGGMLVFLGGGADFLRGGEVMPTF